jgi:hypothetical protein
MTVLKTYARLWADDLGTALPSLLRLTGAEVDLRFAFGEVELAAVGDFLVIAGTPEARAAYTQASATAVVADIDAAVAAVEAAGGETTRPVTTGPTGRHCYVRHPGGAEIEYVEWSAEVVRRVLGPAAS